MPLTQDQHESEGPGYRDRLPLRWLPQPDLPSGLEAERLAETNARLLAAVAMLEEHSKPADEPTATELELQRVHPLRWPARIVAGPAGTVSAEFYPVPEFCQEALERHVFQHHRREVAEARQPARYTG